MKLTPYNNLNQEIYSPVRERQLSFTFKVGIAVGIAVAIIIMSIK